MDTNNTPIFKAFEWASPDNHLAKVPAYVLTKQINTVRDITAGVGVILSMLERDTMAEHEDEPRLMSAVDSATLLRLAIGSMTMLKDEAERLGDWASEHATTAH